MQELLKCDTETRSEIMLLGKWRRQICSTQGCHKPSIKKNAISAKRNKTSYACNWLRHYATSRKIVSSIHDKVIGFLY
jgi:hypothetical protein